MKDSGFLRFVDKYVGTLICFIISILFKFRIKPKTRKIKNVLVIELFEMGAALMSYPSLVYIKKKEKNANIYCLTIRNMRSSWELLNIIPKENIFVVQDKNIFAFFLSLFANILKLRSKNIDLIIDFELFMRISAIISAMIKTKYRSGFHRYEIDGLYRGNFYDFKVSFNQNSHISKNFMSLTKTALDFENEYPNYKAKINSSELVVPSFKSNPELAKEIRKRIKYIYPEYNEKSNELLLVSPDVGYNLMMRNYPKDSFVEVIKRLLYNYPNKLVLLVGTKDSADACRYIHSKVHDKRCIDFCSKVPSLREFYELLSMSELLISNDNGPAHFASATGTKVVALFSTDSPFIYGPLGKCLILYSFYQCSPCICAFNHKTSKCKNNKCLQAIKPEEVYEAAVKVINGNFNERTVNNKLRYV